MMNIEVACSSCGLVELDQDMGFWCPTCGDSVSHEDVISSLIDVIGDLNRRIEIIEHALRQDGLNI